MADFINLKVPARKLYRTSESRQTASCHRQKTMDEAFLTQPERTREGSDLKQNRPLTPPDEDFDLEDPSRPKLELDDIKKRLYQRECHRLGITPVGSFMRAPTRSEISIRHYSLGPSGARALSVPLMLDSTLTSLDLEGNAIGPDGLANMMEMLLEHCSLTHLNLKGNNLGSRGATLICQVLQTNKLIVSLNVAANEFVDKDGIVFANMLRENKSVKFLDLSDNMFSHLSGKHLGDALSQNETLDTLDLSWNQFREGGAAKLLDGVKDNIGLKTLTLAFNSFSRGLCEKPVDSLGTTLSGNSTLKSLDVSNNRLGDLDLFMVAKSLKDNETLETLKIGHNLVTVRATSGLLKAVLVNESSGIKLLDMTDLPLAEDDLGDVESLESRGVKVIYGPVHQKETDFESAPRQSRNVGKGKGGKEKKQEERKNNENNMSEGGKDKEEQGKTRGENQNELDTKQGSGEKDIVKQNDTAAGPQTEVLVKEKEYSDTVNERDFSELNGHGGDKDIDDNYRVDAKLALSLSTIEEDSENGHTAVSADRDEHKDEIESNIPLTSDGQKEASSGNSADDGE